MGNTKLVNSLGVGMKVRGWIVFPMELLWSLRKAPMELLWSLRKAPMELLWSLRKAMYHTFLRL